MDRRIPSAATGVWNRIGCPVVERVLLRGQLALAVIVAANGCSTPTAPTAPAPPAAPRAALSIGLGAIGPAVGIADYSPMLFDAGASTGVGLSYRLEFGDGTESPASRTTHVPVVPGCQTDGHRPTRPKRHGHSNVPPCPTTVSGFRILGQFRQDTSCAQFQSLWCAVHRPLLRT
jgi:hypothetical protein